jgi:hypothetical protein
VVLPFLFLPSFLFPNYKTVAAQFRSPACGVAGESSCTRVAWWQAKKTKSRFFAQNPREEEAGSAQKARGEEAVLAALGMTGRRLFQKQSAYGTTEVVP